MAKVYACRITNGINQAIEEAGLPQVSGESVPYLVPKNAGIQAIVAVRCQERFTSITQVFLYERAYVRRAILRSNRILYLTVPGCNPLLLLFELQEEVITTDYQTRTVSRCDALSAVLRAPLGTLPTLISNSTCLPKPT
jgi:hypothetical protein